MLSLHSHSSDKFLLVQNRFGLFPSDLGKSLKHFHTIPYEHGSVFLSLATITPFNGAKTTTGNGFKFHRSFILSAQFRIPSTHNSTRSLWLLLLEGYRRYIFSAHHQLCPGTEISIREPAFTERRPNKTKNKNRIKLKLPKLNGVSENHLTGSTLIC